MADYIEHELVKEIRSKLNLLELENAKFRQENMILGQWKSMYYELKEKCTALEENNG